jgi:hypothetical protein
MKLSEARESGYVPLKELTRSQRALIRKSNPTSSDNPDIWWLWNGIFFQAVFVEMNDPRSPELQR